ncbi:MAG: ABC transporter ATP-binding protein [Verrucomicrobiota bacterium]
MKTDVTRKTALRFEKVCHRYGKPRSVNEVSFEVKTGEIICLLGPSGCGKTTLLRLASGLEAPESGEIYLNDLLVADSAHVSPPEDRSISLVFQDYALFPHLTVGKNVAFGLSSATPSERQKRVEEVLGLVGLGALKDRYPHTLSGGQQQRVALARALAIKPSVMLMDEPFSNLDTTLRFAIREETRQVLKNENTATLLVTHDGEEASHLADRILLLDHGEIVQTGTPEDFFFSPSTAFSARFFGETTSVEGHSKKGTLVSPLGEWTVSQDLSDGPVEIVVRHQAFQFQEPGEDAALFHSFATTIIESRIVGGKRVVEFASDKDPSALQTYHAFQPPTENFEKGMQGTCWIDKRLVFVFERSSR